jgi:hypothetical protein
MRMILLMCSLVQVCILPSHILYFILTCFGQTCTILLVDDRQVAMSMWLKLKNLQSFYATNCAASVMPSDLKYWNMNNLGIFTLFVDDYTK